MSKGEFPITTLRPIPIKSAIKEILWIYQDQTNDLSVLQEKYGVQYWNDWEVEGTGTIGERYGAIVKNMTSFQNPQAIGGKSMESPQCDFFVGL